MARAIRTTIPMTKTIWIASATTKTQPKLPPKPSS
jgi:hypothetical protein